MKTTYIAFSTAIKGISNSEIASNENNDCVVRAFASAFEIEYDESHKIVADKFQRKNRQGTFGFSPVMNLMSKNDIMFNGKRIKIITHEHDTMLYYTTVKGVKTLRNTTTSYFIKKYSVGTYIVTVSKHAFTIKDGVVIGNYSDAKQNKKHIHSAWKIG